MSRFLMPLLSSTILLLCHHIKDTGDQDQTLKSKLGKERERYLDIGIKSEFASL